MIGERISHRQGGEGGRAAMRLSNVAMWRPPFFWRRHPTFWLDKVCIDQDNIIDGLKVLPINVTASHRMLVLCGKSYASRLW